MPILLLNQGSYFFLSPKVNVCAFGTISFNKIIRAESASETLGTSNFSSL